MLPASIPDRSDFGLYTELVDRGVGAAESCRLDQAISAISSFRGIDGPRVDGEIRIWAGTHHKWWEPNWRAVTTGMWLANSGVRQSEPAPVSLLCRSTLERKEVIS